MAPRLASGIVSLMPVDMWAIGSTAVACLLIGFVAAGAFLASRDLIPDQRIRVGVAAIPVLVPIARVEATGNLANIHWFFAYLMFWILFVRPRTPREAVGWSFVALAACLTETQCLIFAPVVLFLLWRVPLSRVVLSGWVVGVAIQTVTFLSSPRWRPEGLPSAGATVRGYLTNAVLGGVVGYQASVDALVEGSGWSFPIAVIVLVLLLAAYAAVHGTPETRLALLTAVAGSAASWTLSYAYNNHVGFDYSSPPFWLTRWGTAAAMLLLGIIPIFAQSLALNRPERRIAPILLVVGLILGMGVSLPASYRQGPSWRGSVADASSHCTSTSAAYVSIPQLPAGWELTVPCSRLP